MSTPLPLPNDFDLRGRTAIVTGGAGLLGAEHVRALIALGACVYAADLNEDRTNVVCDDLNTEGLAGEARAIRVDVASRDSVSAALETIVAEAGGVHVLVNNAAIDPKVTQDSIVETSRLEHFPLEQWDFQISVGLTGAFLCSQIFGHWMAEHDGGVILNIASDLAVFAPDQRLYRRDGLPPERQPVKPVTYSVIKTGLIGLTRYLSTYWADQGVRANALSPGGVYNGQADDFVARLSELIPMGRMAERDEYRAAVQFLCSDASRYMNGQNIVMDGGRSAW